jgi:hypothetical protein
LAAEGLTHFHMTDFEAWKPPFDFTLPNGGRDKERHNRLLNSLLGVMLDHIEHFAGFAAGSPISKERRRAHTLAMEDCVAAAVKHAVHELWEKYQQPINLIFGHQKHFGYDKVMKYRNLYDWGRGKDRLGTVAMDTPTRLPQLQAADILAYEMSKDQRDRQRRYPFTTLINGAKDRGIPMTLTWNVSDLLSGRRAR